MVFRSLDFLYVPTADVAATYRRYVDDLGAGPVFFIHGMGTTVAAVRTTEDGPLTLLSGHLHDHADDRGHGDVPILVHRVDDYDAAIAALRAAGVAHLHQLEIPHGPCASFTFDDGQRFAIYELVRPEAVDHFTGRFDGP